MNHTAARKEFFDALAQFMSPRAEGFPMDALTQFAQLRYARQGMDFVFNANRIFLEPPPPVGKDAEMRPGVYREALALAWRRAATRLLKHYGFNRWGDVTSSGVAMHFDEVNAELCAPSVLIRFDESSQSIPLVIMGTEQSVEKFRSLLTDLGKMSIEQLNSYLHREDYTTRQVSLP